MKDIIYAAPWAKDKINSWSGTIYYLRESLAAYCNVRDIDTEVFSSRSPSVLAYRAIAKVEKKLKIHKMDMNMSRMQLMDKYISIESDTPILQFEECPGIRANTKQYIYQDLSVLFVKNLYTDDKTLFGISGFQKNDIQAISKRNEMQKYFYDRAAGIFTMSHWLHDYLSGGGYSGKVHFAGGGINLNANLIDESRKQGNKILFVGKDFERKNGPFVINAFSLAKKVRPDIELYIAGPKNLDVSNIDGVHSLGRLSFDNVVEYFNICDIFCMPSKFEAYGIVFPEALTFGLPCIGRNAFEMPYFIEDGVTGGLLKHENAGELAKLMLNLLENTEIKNTVRSRRGYYLNEYSWDTVAKRMMEVMFK